MTKRHYLDELNEQLYFLSGTDREDVIREFESHMDDTQAVRKDLSEDELVDRLPPPASIAARYHAEAKESESDGGDRHGNGEQTKRRGWAGFTLNDLGSMFRFARSEEKELSGTAEDVERVEIESISCDLKTEPGNTFSYRIRGRWSDDTVPAITRNGGRWRIDCGLDADRLELVLPASLVELIVKTVSGDIDTVLPDESNLTAKLVSGDLSCKGAGGVFAVITASGDVSVDGRSTDVDVRTASGDVRISGSSGDVNVASQSGDLSIQGVSAEQDVKIQTMSGDVRVKLKAGAAPEILAESISGDVSSPGERVGRGQVSNTIRATGGPGRVHAKSVSGDVTLE